MLLWLLLTASCLYQIGTVWLTRQFLLQEVIGTKQHPPIYPLSHLKALKGANSQTVSVLETHCDQSYQGAVELFFCAGDPEDLGLKLAHQLVVAHPHVRVLSQPMIHSYPNPKITALNAAYPYCHQPFVISTDCDMRAHPDFLSKMMADFDDPRVGMVTSLYCIRRVPSASVALEALSVLDFATAVLTARAKEGLSFGLGAGMAFRREALEEIGGFASVGDYLADDFQLGNKLHRAGWKVKLAGTILEDVLPQTSFRGYLIHQLRWMRTLRVSRPGGHVSYIATQGVLWVLGLVLWCGWTRSTGLASLLWMGLRVACARRCWTFLGGQAVNRWVHLVLVKDLLYLGLWVFSLVGDTVIWAGQRYHLYPDGRIQPSSERTR
jgi:ceramide glucosyltransferase